MEERKLIWGIVRYLPGSGRPDRDRCAFDGWYTDELDAHGVYALWCLHYPRWIVSLVQQKEARFPPQQ